MRVIVCGGRDYDDFDSFINVIETKIPHPKYLEFVLKNMCCGVKWDLPNKILNMLRDFHELSEKGYIKNKDILTLSDAYKLIFKDTPKHYFLIIYTAIYLGPLIVIFLTTKHQVHKFSN